MFKEYVMDPSASMYDLADALKINTSIVNLYFQDECQCPSDAPLVTVFDINNSNANVVTLYICKDVKYREMSALSDSIRFNSTITRISLDGSVVGENQLYGFIHAIQFNPMISTIEIYEIYIPTYVMESISTMLKTSSSIVRLGMHYVTLSDDRFYMLCVALMINSSLQILNLERNYIGYYNTCTLARVVHVNTSIACIDLSSNLMDTKAENALAKVLDINACLSHVKLDDNRIFGISKVFNDRVASLKHDWLFRKYSYDHV